MKTGFYPKLAFDGIRKNRRMYVPFICTCIGMVMMFYIISYLHYSDTIASMNGGQIMRSTLNLGSIVVGIFSCIFLFYTNSFLIRRRKKEFGLYHILGMGKLNIARILFWETLLTAVISLVLGIGFGILFSKLAELAMARLTHAQIIYSMHISPDSILFTLTVFGCIFILLFFNTLRQIHFSNAITLVKSESVGEKSTEGKYSFRSSRYDLFSCCLLSCSNSCRSCISTWHVFYSSYSGNHWHLPYHDRRLCFILQAASKKLSATIIRQIILCRSPRWSTE